MEASEDINKNAESRDHVTLEITQAEPDHAHSLTTSIARRLEAISFPISIFCVPPQFLIQNKDAYQPMMVSIGPIHHGKTHLQHMEFHKWEYLNSLISRKLDSKPTLDTCIKALKELEPKVRASYQDNFAIESDEFVKMMLLDGGFMIELLLRYTIRGLRRRDDPLFRSPEKFQKLRNDLILLENQVPFFVLKKIYSLVPLPKQCDKSISELSLKFFKTLINGDVELLREKYNFEASSHLLDLIWKSYLPSSSKVPLSSGTGTGRSLHCASKLQDAGLKVKSIEAESALDVKLVKGVLLMPSINVHNYLEILFQNLIAMEHCHDEKATKHITSYAFLMKGLLQSKADVNLLNRRGIFLTYVGRKDDVVNMFKKLCENVELDKFYYEGMWEQINGYGRTRLGVLSYNVKRKLRQLHCRYSGAVLGVSLVIFVLLWILFIILYIFIRRRHS